MISQQDRSKLLQWNPVSRSILLWMLQSYGYSSHPQSALPLLLWTEHVQYIDKNYYTNTDDVISYNHNKEVFPFNICQPQLQFSSIISLKVWILDCVSKDEAYKMLLFLLFSMSPPKIGQTRLRDLSVFCLDIARGPMLIVTDYRFPRLELRM